MSLSKKLKLQVTRLISYISLARVVSQLYPNFQYHDNSYRKFRLFFSSVNSKHSHIKNTDNCEPTFGGTTCETIEGRMTVFYKDEATDPLRRQKRYLQDETSTSSTDTSAVITLAQSTIKSKMDGGEYISAHDAIIDLTYLGDSTQDISVSEEVVDGIITTDTETEALGGDLFPIYGWVLIGAGSFLLAAGFYMQRYMATRKANNNDDDDDDDEEDYDAIETGS